MKVNRMLLAISMPILALFSVAASGLGEQEYIVEKDFSALTPIYMTGHNGDPQWIEGFSFSGQIFLNGGLVGTVSGEARLWNPPMNMSEIYDQVTMRITNTINGLGTFQVYAQGVTVASSTSATSGDYLLAWSGSVVNGTGYFNDFFGTSAGSGLSNLFTGTATATEILTLRAGF
jgi:hypothetical protein